MTTSKCFWIGFRSKVSTFMWEWPTHMVLFWKMEGSHFVKHHFPIIFVICLLTFGLLLWLRLKSILGSFCTLFLLCNNIILNYVWAMDSKKKYKPWNWGWSGLKMWQGFSPFEMKWKASISWFRFYFTNLTVYRLSHHLKFQMTRHSVHRWICKIKFESWNRQMERFPNENDHIS